MALLITGLPVVQQGRKTEGSESVQGHTRNYRFAVPVKKCLYSHVCFLKLVSGLWLAMARFFCYYILFENCWLITCKHEYLWAFLICTMLSLILEIVSCILICKSSLFIQIRWIPTINLAGRMADIQNLRFQGLSNSQFFITMHVKRTSCTNDERKVEVDER